VSLEQFAANNPDSGAKLWHAKWAAVTGVVLKEGADRLQYGQLPTEGRRLLAQYLRDSQGMPVSAFSRDEQLAFWLNFYNAAAFSLVLEALDDWVLKASNKKQMNPNYKPRYNPRKPYMSKNSPWREPRFTVEGVSLSLQDIEHRILYAHWPSPLVVYGLSCPAKGCPTVPRKPFLGATVWQQLESAARRFVNRDGTIKMKRRGPVLSSLYVWHRARFGDDEALFAHISRYANADLKQELTGVAGMSDHDFNWRMNGLLPALRRGQRGVPNRGSGEFVAGRLLADSGQSVSANLDIVFTQIGIIVVQPPLDEVAP
jgi:hypothetical protein